MQKSQKNIVRCVYQGLDIPYKILPHLFCKLINMVFTEEEYCNKVEGEADVCLSRLLSYIVPRLEFLKKNITWSILQTKDFSSVYVCVCVSVCAYVGMCVHVCMCVHVSVFSFHGINNYWSKIIFLPSSPHTLNEYQKEMIKSLSVCYCGFPSTAFWMIWWIDFVGHSKRANTKVNGTKFWSIWK